MSIEAQLNDLLKDSMRAKDAQTADCIRMIKTKHMERRTAAGFKGPLDDNLWLDVIGAYQKQLRKAREEYAAVGERGAAAFCLSSISKSHFARGSCPRSPATMRCARSCARPSCAWASPTPSSRVA